jgi:hypothetical protein
MTDDELRNAFDPSFTFPPIVRPPESAERTLARLDALAALNMQACPWCSVTKTVLRMDGDVPNVMGIDHADDCPEGGTITNL